MIYIVGGGWYGCYIASLLQELKYDYKILEKSEIFSGASGFNQNRLHLGYHYPRDYETRKECLDGYQNFKSEFPSLSISLKKNIFAVSENSLLDFRSYLAIYSYEQYQFEIINPDDHQLKNITGAISVNEDLILTDKAREYWYSKNLNIQENTFVELKNSNLFINGQNHGDKNLVIDCTWGALDTDDDYFEEYFLVFVLEKKCDLTFDALTIMDGPFFSIYPVDERQHIYTLTHVKHGVIESIDGASANKISEVQLNIVSDVENIFPEFSKYFNFKGSYISRKLKKIESASANRTASYLIQDNVLKIKSGKISSIFGVKPYVEKYLEINF